MPAGQPFTRLCQELQRPPRLGRVDLHLHTTASDGTYTPAQVVELAQRCGLVALAVTDHDTTAGVVAAQRAAAGALEVTSGVEISAEHRGRELHLLGYFFDLADAPLQHALAQLRAERVHRFHAMIERLRALGVEVCAESLPGSSTLGRRHLAELIVAAGRAATVREAFQRFLGDHGRAALPKKRLPVAEAIGLVRDAGGITACAHPWADCDDALVGELTAFGLQALEVEFPSCRPSRGRELRRLAAAHGLGVTGGSDCHGPGAPRQAVGACSISAAEFLDLQARSSTVGRRP